VRVCAYCGRPGPLTREHVCPAFLYKLFPRQNFGLNQKAGRFMSSEHLALPFGPEPRSVARDRTRRLGPSPAVRAGGRHLVHPVTTPIRPWTVHVAVHVQARNGSKSEIFRFFSKAVLGPFRDLLEPEAAEPTVRGEILMLPPGSDEAEESSPQSRRIRAEHAPPRRAGTPGGYMGLLCYSNARTYPETTGIHA